MAQLRERLGGRARNRGAAKPLPSSGERRVERDLGDACERLRDRAADLRALCSSDERVRVDPGTDAAHRERDLRDPLARDERDGGRGVELLGRVPACASACASAIEKHAEWAAAMSSSGLVLPFGASAREAQLTSSGPKAPLPASWIVPEPSISEPCQVVLIVRSVAIVGASSSVGGRHGLSSVECSGHGDRSADARISAENGQPASAASAACANAASSQSGDRAVRDDLRVDDLVALALDLVHRDRAADVEPLRRRAGLRQLARERHRETAAVGGGEQLLGARLLGCRATRDARLNGRSTNAPDDAALIAPVPRARLPSQLTSASRTILGMIAPLCSASCDAARTPSRLGHDLDAGLRPAARSRSRTARPASLPGARESRPRSGRATAPASSAAAARGRARAASSGRGSPGACPRSGSARTRGRRSPAAGGSG